MLNTRMTKSHQAREMERELIFNSMLFSILEFADSMSRPFCDKAAYYPKLLTAFDA